MIIFFVLCKVDSYLVPTQFNIMMIMRNTTSMSLDKMTMDLEPQPRRKVH